MLIALPEEYGRLFHDEEPVQIVGTLNIREDRANSLLVQKINELASVSKKLFVKIPSFYEKDRVREITCAYPGGVQLILVDGKRVAKAAPDNWSVKLCAQLISDLKACFGEGNVVVK